MPSDEHAPKSDANRAWLAEMLEQTRLYHSSQEYLDLLDFMARMGNFSPFNALLLRIQRPGLAWAASRWDWKIRFEREVKADARPLLILWPFGPVALVYDVLDTEGQPLPEAASQMFRATGPVTKAQMQGWVKRLGRKNILVEMRDWGDAKAGEIICEVPAKQAHEVSQYRLRINRNHDPNVQFATLAHELGHLFLGHLGLDQYHAIPAIDFIPAGTAELEAESLSYLVCKRWRVATRADSYLVDYAKPGTKVDAIDLDRLTRATGQVEAILGISAKTLLEPRKKGGDTQLDLFSD